ncbi:hypothetical protein AGOR_G00067360 [Albula goreensis]|uniref:C2H2-type domain-containing protein n=1 Tax=Albula goreensis TaxID=1534307 RepID=A0A8T3E087_9TELE|nr:hypothetical protein AGOR_G00067360 [Albula goreensis]
MAWDNGQGLPLMTSLLLALGDAGFSAGLAQTPAVGEGDVEHPRSISSNAHGRTHFSRTVTSTDRMAEESRGKRRKQANPRRNQVDIEKLSVLGSEGEDEGVLWGMEAQDSQDKTSLTASEGTDSGSPAPCTRSHSLSPSDIIAPGEREDGRGSLMIYGQGEDPRGLEDLAHDFLMQLRQASGGHPEHLAHNGTTTIYRSAPAHSELRPGCWSPGTHVSPDRQEGSPSSPDTMRALLSCPFCQRSYRRDAALREHIRFCHERDSGHLICPLCGYMASHRAQMERHALMHTQAQNKHPAYDHAMENRKFKCLQCGKAFKYKHHLKEHLRIHSGEKPYECTNCKKRFSHSGSYSSHLSSKKCLSGGGGGGGGGMLNGQMYSTYLNSSSPSSPPVGGGRNSGKGSPFFFQTAAVQPELTAMESSGPQHPGSPLAQSQKPQRLWEPTPEFYRSEIFKNTTLLPYLHSGEKFEHVLQEMLRRGVQEEGLPLGVEDAAGRGSRGVVKGSPNGCVAGERAGPGEPLAGGVTCRWCSQLFPSPAVLLQHERYLCKMNQDAVEVLEGPRAKDSVPLNFSRPNLQAHQPHKANGFSGDRSPLRRASWPPLPHPSMRSPLPLHPDSLGPHPLWSSQEATSPAHPTSPFLEIPASPFLEKRRGLPKGFSSPLCLDLSVSASPPNRPTPSCGTPSSAGSQNEPLDLSLPKQRWDPEDERGCNGTSPPRERKESEGQGRRVVPPPLQRPGAYPGTPLFRGSMYSAFPLFNPIMPAGLGGSGHQDSLSSLPPSHSAGFLAPMSYMLESDTESFLKRFHQERQAFMSEAMSRGCLDYLPLMEDGAEGEGGAGRKRLKKTDEGLYACDICDKTFQKSSSLLRHKYEHTGKRPHECQICKKAFKHKHHLIEHSRLHSGEALPVRQHMNHRYAYCSRDQDADPDPDATGDELPMGAMALCQPHSLDLGPGPRGAGLGSEGAPPRFFSDSSLDGGMREEEEERTRGAERGEGLGVGGGRGGASLRGERGSEDGSEGSGAERGLEQDDQSTDRQGDVSFHSTEMQQRNGEHSSGYCQLGQTAGDKRTEAAV